jgi:ATP-binding cassette subfamily G (WHITE) protein 2
VRENILYNALLRLPAEMDISQKINIVDDVIKILGLVHIQNNLVGDPEVRGISGGQRKRVNMYVTLSYYQKANVAL